MSTTVTKSRTTTGRESAPSHRAVPPTPVRRNPVPGFLRRTLTSGATLFWTAIVVIPIYWLVVTSLRSQSDFTSDSPSRCPATRRWTATGPSWTATSPPTSSTA